MSPDAIIQNAMYARNRLDTKSDDFDVVLRKYSDHTDVNPNVNPDINPDVNPVVYPRSTPVFRQNNYPVVQEFAKPQGDIVVSSNMVIIMLMILIIIMIFFYSSISQIKKNMDMLVYKISPMYR